MNKKDQLSELIQRDKINGIDTGIEERLKYMLLLKSSRSKLRQNSFAGFTSWLFSFQSIGLKTIIVSCLVFITLTPPLIKPNNTETPFYDSTLIKSSIVIDTAMLPSKIEIIK